MKIAAWVFTIFFLVAVGLQYNDPDPGFWMAIYGLAGLSTILFNFKNSFWRWSSLVPLGMAVYELATYANGYFHNNLLGNSQSEFFKEVGGLLIVMVWILFLHNKAYKSVNVLRRQHEPN